MASGYKADQYVEPTGAYGGGNQRAYDKINGKTGYKNSYGYFIPDKDTSDEYDEPSPTVNYSAPTGTGAVVTEDTSAIGDFLKGAGKAAVAAPVVASAIHEYNKTGDVTKAAKRGARSLLCVIGIIVLLLMFIGSCTTVIFLRAYGYGLGTYIEYIGFGIGCILVIIGLIRVIAGKTFFPASKKKPQ